MQCGGRTSGRGLWGHPPSEQEREVSSSGVVVLRLPTRRRVEKEGGDAQGGEMDHG